MEERMTDGQKGQMTSEIMMGRNDGVVGPDHLDDRLLIACTLRCQPNVQSDVGCRRWVATTSATS